MNAEREVVVYPSISVSYHQNYLTYFVNTCYCGGGVGGVYNESYWDNLILFPIGPTQYPTLHEAQQTTRYGICHTKLIL
jgi:hypothetical protein